VGWRHSGQAIVTRADRMGCQAQWILSPLSPGKDMEADRQDTTWQLQRSTACKEAFNGFEGGSSADVRVQDEG